MSARDVHGVVFSGPGIGCLAAYEVGVMKALASGECAAVGEQPWDPEIYAGAVFGALNAAVLASRADRDVASAVRRLERLWVDDIGGSTFGGNGVFRLRGNPLPYLAPRELAEDPLRPFVSLLQDGAFLSAECYKRSVRFLRSEGALTHRLGHLLDSTAFFSTEPYREVLRKHLDLERLRRCGKQLRVVATDWVQGKPRIFTQNDLTASKGYEILAASAAISLIFPMVQMNGGVYAGGGALLRTPLTPAAEAVPDDADHLVLHVIRANPPVEEIPFNRMDGSIQNFTRSFTMSLEYISDLECERIVAANDQIAALRQLSRAIGAEGSIVEVVEWLRQRERELAASRPTTLHFYRPKAFLMGTLDILDFEARRILELIDLGHRDALGHDCEADGCVLASRPAL